MSSPTGESGVRAQAGWWVAGGLVLVLLAVVGFSVFSDAGRADVTPTVGPGTLGPAPQVDLSAMTPREAADRLFNRVMQALATEDMAEAQNFLPMALDAYDLAQPLDADGWFHLALLQRTASEYQASLESATEGLRDNPDHLLNLSAAAEASRELGDVVQAGEYYERMLQAWDQERAALRPEYEEHAPLLPLIREDAEQFVEGVSP